MGSGALGETGCVNHDFSAISGYCVECAMPRGTTKPCEPSTDDSAQGIAELRRGQIIGAGYRLLTQPNGACWKPGRGRLQSEHQTRQPS